MNKVYVIYDMDGSVHVNDMDGWEIHGIEACFSSYEAADKHFEMYRKYYEHQAAEVKTATGRTQVSFDEFKKASIHEVEVRG